MDSANFTYHPSPERGVVGVITRFKPFANFISYVSFPFSFQVTKLRLTREESARDIYLCVKYNIRSFPLQGFRNLMNKGGAHA